MYEVQVKQYITAKGALAWSQIRDETVERRVRIKLGPMAFAEPVEPPAAVQPRNRFSFFNRRFRRVGPTPAKPKPKLYDDIVLSDTDTIESVLEQYFVKNKDVLARMGSAIPQAEVYYISGDEQLIDVNKSENRYAEQMMKFELQAQNGQTVFKKIESNILERRTDADRDLDSTDSSLDIDYENLGENNNKPDHERSESGYKSMTPSPRIAPKLNQVQPIAPAPAHPQLSSPVQSNSGQNRPRTR